MKKPVLFLAAALLGLSSFSQNFQPATIVTTDGHTIAGEINYKNWKKNPSQIQFRKHAASSPASFENYTAKNIKSFSVSGDRYVSAIVDIDDRSDNTGSITTEPQVIVHRDTVFLRTLVSGTKSLYYYYDDIDHFYILKDETFELLRFKKYMAAGRYGKVVNYNREFAMQVSKYLDGCEVFSRGVDKAKYDADNLKSAFSKYYKCKSGTPEFTQSREGEKFEFGVIAGVSNTDFKVTSSSQNTTLFVLSRIDFPTSVNFTGGVFMDIVFPRQRGKLSLNNELMYSSYETNGSYRQTVSPKSYNDYIYEFAYSYVKMNNMIRYKFPLGKSSIFLNGGVSSGALLSQHSQLTRFRKSGEIEHTQVDNAFDVRERKFELGMLLGAGFRTHRASIELRAERGSGPFTEANTAAKVYRYSALLGFRLK